MERIDAIVRDPLFQECLAKTAEIEKEREFCKHDLQHFVDVARITYILILESGALWSFIKDNDLKGTREAKEVVYAAGILHDIGRWRQYETGRITLQSELAMPGKLWSGQGSLPTKSGSSPGRFWSTESTVTR